MYRHRHFPTQQHPSTISMKLRYLESELSEVDVFENPKVDLEQVPTSPHIAACMIHAAAEVYGDIEGKLVGDFGVGTGMLRFVCVYFALLYFV